jgi:hypothetical protein
MSEGLISTGLQREKRAGGVTGKGFVPGRSGNPGGRPKGGVDVQALARQHTPAAIQALVAALASPRERVAAAQVLLDRAWGRVPQAVVGDAGRPLLVDFRWSDGTSCGQAQPDAATIIEAEPADTGTSMIRWANGK